MANKLFEHPKAAEILESKTTTAQKIRALYSLSNACFNTYFLCRYFKVKEWSVIHAINRETEKLSPEPIHPHDIKEPLKVNETVCTVACNSRIQINYV